MKNEETGFLKASNQEPKGKFNAILGLVIEKISTITWRLGYDRQALAAFLGRYGAHISILTLVLLVGIFQHASLAPDEYR